MKKERKVLLFATIIILIGISISLILEKNIILKDNRKIIKEMNESNQVEELNNQINLLNTEHTEYINYIKTCKEKIATAITNAGIETNSNETADVMATNIGNILKETTKDATATAEDIANGKTAYVNGNLITGKAINNKSDMVLYKFGTIPNKGKAYKNKSENYIIDKDISNVKYILLYIIVDNDANELNYRIRLDNSITDIAELNLLWRNNSNGIENILFDVSNYSNFKIEAYSANNYAPPVGSIYYTCSFFKDANIEEIINQ